MGHVIFVGGIKGGVGKTFTSNSLIYLHNMYGVDFKLVDADTNNPNVAKLNGYGETKIRFAIDDEESALMSRAMAQTDRLLDLAWSNEVIVNLPGDVETKIIYWFKKTGLLYEDITEGQVKFSYWFLSNGSYESVSLFLDLLEKLSGPNIDWVFVKNLGLCRDWTRVEEREEFIKAKIKYDVIIVELPGLAAVERDYLEKHQITFSEAINSKTIPLLPRQRIKDFTKALDRNFINSGALSLLYEKSLEKNAGLSNNGAKRKIEGLNGNINAEEFLEEEFTPTSNPDNNDNGKESLEKNAIRAARIDPEDSEDMNESIDSDSFVNSQEQQSSNIF